MKWWVTSPREVERFLAASETPALPIRCSVELADFQRQGAETAAGILARRGGVLIADSVGLGKTFIALALIESSVQAAGAVTVVIPASLRRMWRTELRRIAAENVTLLSHTALALGRTPDAPPTLVVVDEAHAFRNPGTRRYRALRALCQRCRVVLLTATPINNSLSDLYFQLRLFCADGAFRDLGIGSLRALLLDPKASLRRRTSPYSSTPEARSPDLERLCAAVIVRRTRAQVRAGACSPLVAGAARFPRSLEAVPVAYALPIPVARIAELLAALNFAAYRSNGDVPVDLLRYGLLKRLESSLQAFRTTLNRQIRFHEQFLAAFADGRMLRPATFRTLFQHDDVALQLVFHEIALDAVAIAPCTVGHDAQRDLQTLRDWRSSLPAADAKLVVLLELLRGRRAGEKTIVFTEYRDTARYLWRALRIRFATGLVDGGGAWLGETRATRAQVVERFAPFANNAHHPTREAVSVLIATDVLAEGVNLQDADTVLSYDLPWNPVKLIQRAGRIDRLGSPHDVVRVFNFIPDREFDAFLGLARTIRNKLETVRNAVGLERPVLEPGDEFGEVWRAVAVGDARVLDRIEGRGDPPLDVLSPWSRGAATSKLALAPPSPSAAVTINQSRTEGRAPVPPGSVPIASTTHRPTTVLAALRSLGETQFLVRSLVDGSATADAGRIISKARNCRRVRAVPDEVFAAVEAMVQELNGTAEPVAIGTRTASALWARRIRARLAELPLGYSDEVYQRADRVLCALESVRDRLVEDALWELRSADNQSLHQLFDEVESALAQASKPRWDNGSWQLLGVIAAD